MSSYKEVKKEVSETSETVFAVILTVLKVIFFVAVAVFVFTA